MRNLDALYRWYFFHCFFFSHPKHHFLGKWILFGCGFAILLGTDFYIHSVRPFF